jgi:hypothetical protein
MGARAWVLAAITTVAFVSPLRALWANDAAPWWAPFAAWAAIVALAAVALQRRGADDGD